MFDTDRQPDRRVENSYFLTDVGWNARMGHACGKAGERLSPAQAHCELEDLQCIQKFECRGLAADNVERKRGPRAGTLPREHTPGGGALFMVSEIMDLRHFVVVAQPLSPVLSG